MKFKTDDQRKACFASMGYNKFARATTVPGYTGSVLVADVAGVDEPFVVDPYGRVHAIKETAILPGEDYKRGLLEDIAKKQMGLDYQHMNLGEEDNKELVRTISGAERNLVGYPVYSRRNEFAKRNDDLWNMVMATRDKRIKATPLDIERYAALFDGNPGFQSQIIKDLRVYPMYDAIGVWLDSAEFVDDATYAMIENAARLYLSEVG